MSGELVYIEINENSSGIDIKNVDEQIKKIIIYLKVASSYLTNKNYSKLVESLVLNLNRLRVETKYLNEIKEIKKGKKRIKK